MIIYLNYNIVLHLKGLTPNGMLPLGILDGQTSIEGVEGIKTKNITSSINSFEDAKHLDRVNEKMPVRRKENESKTNSVMAQVATTSGQNAPSNAPTSKAPSSSATSNNTQHSAHTSKQTGSSNATSKWPETTTSGHVGIMATIFYG